MKRRSSFAIAFPVASVWFGALVGPSMVSGAFASLYFVPYGLFGLILPLISMGVASVIIAMGAEVTRHERVYSYSELSNRVYGRYSRALSPMLELYMVLAMVIGGSSVVSMAGTFFNGLTGLPAIYGSVLISILSIVLVLWGAKLVRASSLVISLLMIFGMVALALSAILERPAETASLLSDPEKLPLSDALIGVKGALALALSNSVNALTLCSVEQKVETKRDSVWIGILSFVMNSFAFIITTLMILPYKEVQNDAVPVLSIVNTFLCERLPWLPALYMITMFFALLSSGAPQLNAVAYRINKLYPDKEIFRSPLLRNLITGVIYFLLCILISTVGLRAIIGKGYATLGFLAIPLIVIPLVVIMPLRYRKEKSLVKVNYNENKQVI